MSMLSDDSAHVGAIGLALEPFLRPACIERFATQIASQIQALLALGQSY